MPWPQWTRCLVPSLLSLAVLPGAEGPGSNGRHGDSNGIPGDSLAPAMEADERYHPSLASAQAAAQADGQPILLIIAPQSNAELRRRLIGPDALGEHRPHIVVAASGMRGVSVSRYPARLLIAAEGYVIARHEGWLEPEAAQEWLRHAYLSHQRGAWEGMNQPPDAETPLLQRLGSQQPLSRMRASQAVMNDPQPAMPVLLKGLDHELLAVRVACSRLLRRLLPATAPQVDAWSKQAQRHAAAEQLRTWWDEHQELRNDQAWHELEPEALPVVDTALRDLASASPLTRTRAMTTLALLGRGVLPQLAVSWSPDQQTSALCADVVRWAILIPSDLEDALHVRHTLVRGSSQERQEAARKLGAGGGDALPALQALLQDHDMLVRESALHALSRLGGSESMRATASLLTSDDANLRMVAAQQLGQTNNPSAAAYLRDATADDDELVAVAAIAAIEEARGLAHSDVLIARLQDPRWRVRAAAAKALGDLQAQTAGPALLKALEDEDHFVVREVLSALDRLDTEPSPETLERVVKRVPDLAAAVVTPMLRDLDRRPNPAVEASVQRIYKAAPAQAQTAIWQAVNDLYPLREHHRHYQPLYEDALHSADPAVRAAAARTRPRVRLNKCKELLTTFVQDPQREVQQAAATVVIDKASTTPSPLNISSTPSNMVEQLRAGLEQLTSSALSTVDDNDEAPRTQPPDQQWQQLLASGALDHLTNEQRDALLSAAGSALNSDDHAHGPQTIELLSQWHHMLLRKRGEDPNPLMDLALFASDPQPIRSLSRLRAAFAVDHLARAWEGVDLSTVARMLARRLPAGAEDILHKLLADEQLYLQLLHHVEDIAHPPYRQMAAEPQRLISLLDYDQQRDRARSLGQLLLNATGSSPLNIQGSHPAAVQLRQALAHSDNPLAQNLAAFVDLNPTGQPPLPAVKQALAHEHTWVRLSAVQALARSHIQPQYDHSELLLEALADPAPQVATFAAWALLDHRLRNHMTLPWRLDYLYHESLTIRPDRHRRSSSDSTARPFRPSPPVPPAVAALVQRVQDIDPLSDKAEDPDWQRLRRYAATLAGQHGDRTLLDKELEAQRSGIEHDADVLLIGLVVTRDAAYLPALKQRVQGDRSEGELRNYLSYLSGIRGREARALRREINRRLSQLRR